VIAGLETRAASLPMERTQALARLIARRNPALVGMQEMYRFTCLELPMPVADGKGCDNPSIAGAFSDQLDDTLAALGGRYVEAATVVNLDLPASLGIPGLPGIPLQIDGMTVFLGVVDRDVIIARTDVPHEAFDFSALNALNPALCPLPSADGCNYQEVASAPLTLPLPGGGSVTLPVRFQRGYVGVHAMVNGVPYRFVNTHLETRLEGFGPLGRYYQTAQAFELEATLGVLQLVAPQPRQIVVGDFNSDPRDVEEIPGIVPPYQIFAAGHTDVWTMRPGAMTARGAPPVGNSCCQDEDLANHRSVLHERVDLIFSLATPRRVLDARLLGESIADKTPPKGFGVWPSDHASVAARLQF
jgi:endonuclease/exonuclease/phosphatase family metal-dependent hydrolase